MPVLKFNQCDYDCRDKRDKRGSFRVYCRRVELECGKKVKDTKKKPWFRKEEHELTSFDFPGGVSQYLEHIAVQPPHLLLLEQYTDAFLYKNPIGSGLEVEAIIKNQWMKAIEQELSYGNPIPLPVLKQYQKLRGERASEFTSLEAKPVVLTKPIKREVLPASELLSSTEQAILNILTNTPVHIDEITIASQLPPGKVSSTLLTLELNNLIKRLPGAYFARK